MTINVGGARSASDKGFQHNGPDAMYVRNFQGRISHRAILPRAGGKECSMS
ncbi:pectate lyase [Nonomuraea sp. NPDC026600]|uniref:pectate lyase n=1 Tax=Nonomuraea sp. NPDC026600 TaxID=3155363 RepID=UPI0033FBA408